MTDDIRELARTVTADQALYATEKFGTDLQWEPMMLAIRLYGAVRAREMAVLAYEEGAQSQAEWAGYQMALADTEIAALLADDGLRELLTEATAPSIS